MDHSSSHMMALPRASPLPSNWPDVEAAPIVRLGKCQGETKRELANHIRTFWTNLDQHLSLLAN